MQRNEMWYTNTDKLLLKQNKLPELRDNQFCFNSTVYYTYNHFTWTVDYRTTWILGLLIKFLTVYLCITFHFFALALEGKGVSYSYKNNLSNLYNNVW
jgi:hypothetical protein